MLNDLIKVVQKTMSSDLKISKRIQLFSICLARACVFFHVQSKVSTQKQMRERNNII